MTNDFERVASSDGLQQWDERFAALRAATAGKITDTVTEIVDGTKQSLATRTPEQLAADEQLLADHGL